MSRKKSELEPAITNDEPLHDGSSLLEILTVVFVIVVFGAIFVAALAVLLDLVFL